MRTNKFFKPALILAAISGFCAAQSATAPQQTFATPQEAAQATINAAANNDTAALLRIFGPAGKTIVESGDPAQDKMERAEFAQRAKEKLQIEQDPANPNAATFTAGNNDWPFPIPLVRRNGKWEFNTAKGNVMVLARRVGRNEREAIEVCRAYVEAQLEYAAQDRVKDGMLQYAQRIVSTPGKQDGLYWPGQPDSLVPVDFADAAAATRPPGSTKRQPFHGYYFRILKAQGPDAAGGQFAYVVSGKMIGGFALVAWPAEYGASGVKTFIVNQQGIVYSKDLGATTTTRARQMTAFNPDKTWREVYTGAE